MLYKNANGLSRDEAMNLALILHKQFNMRQADIAECLGCSQATISLWIKEMHFIGSSTHHLDEKLESTAKTIVKEFKACNT